LEHGGGSQGAEQVGGNKYMMRIPTGSGWVPPTVGTVGVKCAEPIGQRIGSATTLVNGNKKKRILPACSLKLDQVVNKLKDT
jgi:hypothetical protein